MTSKNKNHFRPEERNHPYFKDDPFQDFIRYSLSKKPLYRASNYIKNKMNGLPPTDMILYRYQQRFNVSFLIPLYLTGFFVGTMYYYWNFKVNVVEEKLVENYGADIPVFVKMKYQQLFHYYRSYLIHFYRFKLFYYLDEQVIDPLNDNVLDPKSFDVYQFKRLVRAIKYDERRDKSFDFMNIGEDDIDEFDDFV